MQLTKKELLNKEIQRYKNFFIIFASLGIVVGLMGIVFSRLISLTIILVGLAIIFLVIASTNKIKLVICEATNEDNVDK
jgi:hypothetical protein